MEEQPFPLFLNRTKIFNTTMETQCFDCPSSSKPSLTGRDFARIMGCRKTGLHEERMQNTPTMEAPSGRSLFGIVFRNFSFILGKSVMETRLGWEGSDCVQCVKASRWKLTQLFLSNHTVPPNHIRFHPVAPVQSTLTTSPYHCLSPSGFLRGFSLPVSQFPGTHLCLK